VPAPDAPSAVEVAEATDRVVLGIGTPVLDPPCNPVRLEVRLQAPLGDRTVVDAAGAELPVDTYVPPDPSRLVRAECTEEAARTVVANDVDGGLRSELLDCVDGWMAVLTSTDACPATGEAPGDGCIGNVHTVYWRDVDGHWTITGFDDVTTQFADNVRTCQEERLKVQSQLRHQLELARGGAPEDLGRLQNPPTPTWTLHGHIVP
jgi:hypothetical protein